MQIVFNFHLGCGVLPAIGSYNRLYHNTMKDAIIICLVSMITSVLIILMVSSMVGCMAELFGMEIHEISTAGPPLAFITFPSLVRSQSYKSFLIFFG